MGWVWLWLFGFVEGFVDGVVGEVFGDDLFHHFDEGELVGVEDEFGELVDVVACGLVGDGVDVGAHDFGVVCGEGVFFVVEEFFVEFFAGAESGFDDLDVAVGFEAVELYHFAGHVVDFDGASHVEDEDVAACSHGAGFEDEVAGFGDCHEVAGDFFVGNGNGAVVFDLFAEEWDDRSVGAEDVSEAGGDEAGLVVGE